MDFKLFKRDSSGRIIKPESPDYSQRDFYFKFQFRGVKYTRCLDTNNAAKAQQYARTKYSEICDAVVRGEYDRVKATRSRGAAPVTTTVDTLLNTYERSSVDAGRKTRVQNGNALRQLLAAACELTDDDPKQVMNNPQTKAEKAGRLTIDKVTAEVAEVHFTNASARALNTPDQDDQMSLRKSANSRFSQARCVFAPKARALYRKDGNDLACFDEFLAAGELHKFSRVTGSAYKAPSEAIIASTLKAWQELEDRNLFLAIGHELAFGLRAGEVAQARWSWWSTREGYPVLEGSARVKNGTAAVQVRALDPFWTTLLAKVTARGWKGQPDEFIITGSDTQRTDAIFRSVSDWMQKLGWKTRKTNHALRAYSGSQIAMRYGIYDAQVWLRHSTVKVTEQHYTGFVLKFKPADITTMAARWATTATPAPAIRVLEDLPEANAS